MFLEVSNTWIYVSNCTATLWKWYFICNSMCISAWHFYEYEVEDGIAK